MLAFAARPWIRPPRCTPTSLRRRARAEQLIADGFLGSRLCRCCARGRFWRLSPSSLTSLGAFSDTARASLPATLKYASASERAAVKPWPPIRLPHLRRAAHHCEPPVGGRQLHDHQRRSRWARERHLRRRALAAPSGSASTLSAALLRQQGKLYERALLCGGRVPCTAWPRTHRRADGRTRGDPAWPRAAPPIHIRGRWRCRRRGRLAPDFSTASMASSTLHGGGRRDAKTRGSARGSFAGSASRPPLRGAAR